jgi:hypothetical protein
MVTRCDVYTGAAGHRTGPSQVAEGRRGRGGAAGSRYCSSSGHSFTRSAAWPTRQFIRFIFCGVFDSLWFAVCGCGCFRTNDRTPATSSFDGYFSSICGNHECRRRCLVHLIRPSRSSHLYNNPHEEDNLMQINPDISDGLMSPHRRLASPQSPAERTSSSSISRRWVFSIRSTW